MVRRSNYPQLRLSSCKNTWRILTSWQVRASHINSPRLSFRLSPSKNGCVVEDALVSSNEMDSRKLKSLCQMASPKGECLNVESFKSTFFDGLTSHREQKSFFQCRIGPSVCKHFYVLGRKFDLRIYTLVTSFHPLKAWLAREGFARLSSELFDLDNIDDSRVHLTNMAIQLKIHGDEKKNHSKKGYKWALIKVREYLTARHGPKQVEILFQRIAG